MGRCALLAAAAAAAFTISSPAMAADVIPGNNSLDNMIHLDTTKVNTGTNNVYGITDDGTEVVFYSPNSLIVGTSGAGYAQIDDLDPDTTPFQELIISLADLSGFTAYEFSILFGPQVSGTLQIFYSVLGGGLSDWISAENVGIATGNQDFLVLAEGGQVFDGLRLLSSAPISQIKQNDIEIASVTPVPEPSTWALMLIGFGAVGYSLRRRRRNNMALQAV